jgi:hypothetical protein
MNRFDFQIEEVMIRSNFHQLYKSDKIGQEFDFENGDGYVAISVTQFWQNAVPMIKIIWERKDIWRKAHRFCKKCNRTILNCSCSNVLIEKSSIPEKADPSLESNLYKSRS